MILERFARRSLVACPFLFICLERGTTPGAAGRRRWLPRPHVWSSPLRAPARGGASGSTPASPTASRWQARPTRPPLCRQTPGGLFHQGDLLPHWQIAPFNPPLLRRALGLPGVLPRAVEATFFRVVLEDGRHVGVDAREVAAAVGRPAIRRASKGIQQRQPRFSPTSQDREQDGVASPAPVRLPYTSLILRCHLDPYHMRQDDLATRIRLVAQHIDHQAVGLPLGLAHASTQHLHVQAGRERGPRDDQGGDARKVVALREQGAVADYLDGATLPAGKQLVALPPAGTSRDDS